MSLGYVNTIASSLVEENAQLLCSCFTNNIENHFGGRNLVNALIDGNINIIKVFPPELRIFQEILTAHVGCLHSIRGNNFQEAWIHQKKILECCITILHEDNDWTTPFILQTAKESRLLAYQTRKSEGTIKESKEISECTMLLRNVATGFNNKTNVLIQGTNGFIGAVNELSKILFAQGNLRLCEDIFASYKDRIDSEIPNSPKSQICTFYYYFGRLRLYEDNFKLAREYLTIALTNCDSRAIHNIQMILFFLIPVNMLYGYLPQESLLKQYNFTMYSMLAKAIRNGDLRLYEQVLNDYEHVLINRCLYLTVISLKILVQRSFLKRVIDIYGNSQIPFKYIHIGFNLQDIHLSDDELCSLLSTLKYKGYLKGYVSYAQKTLVVSKTQAFPPIASIMK